MTHPIAGNHPEASVAPAGLLPLVGLLLALVAQPAMRATGAEAEPTGHPLLPELCWKRDAPLAGGGIALIAAAQLLDVSIRPVPPAGLDPAEIGWSIDRERIGTLDARAIRASDLASAACVAYPMAVALASQPSGERARGTLFRSVVYLESFLLATGTSSLIKNSADRPRPYTYVPSSQRPNDPRYDVADDEAFQSMPSSHASSSFCGAAFAMTDQLLSRPQAGWPERVGVAFTGGLLAGMTSTLRVSAGKHFPSDALAGGAIGTASGVLVPLAHRYVTPARLRGPMPSRRAWLQAMGGLCAGIGAGIVIAEAAY